MNDPVRPSSLFGTGMSASAPSGVLATIPNPPPDVARLSSGTILRGVVLGEDGKGHVLVRTELGVLEVATKAHPALDSEVTLQVRSSGAQLHVLLMQNRTQAAPGPAHEAPAGAQLGSSGTGAAPPRLVPAHAPAVVGEPPDLLNLGQTVKAVLQTPAGGGSAPDGVPDTLVRLAPGSELQVRILAVQAPPSAGPGSGPGPAPAPGLPPDAATQAPPQGTGGAPSTGPEGRTGPPSAATTSPPAASSARLGGTSAGVTLAPGQPPGVPPGGGAASAPPSAGPTATILIPGQAGAPAAPAIPAGPAAPPAIHTPQSGPGPAPAPAGGAVPAGTGTPFAPAPGSAQGAPFAPAPGPAPPTAAGGPHPQAVAATGGTAPAGTAAPPAAAGSAPTAGAAGMPAPGRVNQAAAMPPTVPPARPGSVPLTGQVTSITHAGHPVLATPLGTMTLEVRAALPPGTRVTLELPAGAVPEARAPAVTPGALGHAWPALEDAIHVLRELAGPGGGPAAVPDIVPQPGPKLASGILFFLSALSGGNLMRWLGGPAEKALKAAGRDGLLSRLGQDFAQMGRMAEGAGGDWRLLAVPLWDGQSLQQLRLFLRHKDRRRAEAEADATRFILEVEMSRLGEMQLDGLVRAKRFDLILRTRQPLPEAMRADIRQIFSDANEATGYSGNLGFQASRDWHFLPIEDPGAAAPGLVV